MRHSTTYKIAGPKTLRLASSQILPRKIAQFDARTGMTKTVTKGWGDNLQNVEKGMREIFIPDGFTPALEDKCRYYLSTNDTSVFTAEELDKLRIFVQVDQSGAEALIVAYCCEALQYRELFKCGIKPHSFLAMHLFKEIWPKKMREYNLLTSGSDFRIEELIDCPIGDLKKHPYWKNLDLLIKDSDNWPLTERYYYLAKQTEHSSNYDVQPPAFRMNTLEKSGGKIVISKEDSERFLATKFSLFPEIKGYHKWVRECAERTRMLYNLHGHPYTITHYELTETHWKELYSWIPQSTVGEITNIAYTKMYEWIRDTKKRWDLLQNNHDSYLIQCPLTEEFDCAKQAQTFIGQSFTSPIDSAIFQMRSEAQRGFNWSPMKKVGDEVINPLGLREIK